jgi:hypothetical protein
MCKNFQDFQRWQNDIVNNTEPHNSVDNGLYHGVRPMEDNPSSRTRAKRHGDFTRKTLNTHKPWYTNSHFHPTEPSPLSWSRGRYAEARLLSILISKTLFYCGLCELCERGDLAVVQSPTEPQCPTGKVFC